MADQPMTVDEYAKALATEYGTYVALNVIEIGGSRAFNPGDPVPVSHVDRGVVSKDDVARVSTKAAAAVLDPNKGE